MDKRKHPSWSEVLRLSLIVVFATLTATWTPYAIVKLPAMLFAGWYAIGFALALSLVLLGPSRGTYSDERNER